ncbi:AAA family ATPase [Streptomyces sp. NPDC002004]
MSCRCAGGMKKTGRSVQVMRMPASWLSLGLGLAVAAGGHAFDSLPVQGGPVLYLALEDTPRRLQTRMGKILGGQAAPAGLTLVRCAGPPHRVSPHMTRTTSPSATPSGSRITTGSPSSWSTTSARPARTTS